MLFYFYEMENPFKHIDEYVLLFPEDIQKKQEELTFSKSRNRGIYGLSELEK